MTELKYDPEFPYVYVSSNGTVQAKFRSKIDAEYFEDDYGKVIDTTPKPKIPEDAEFITWTDEEGYVCFAYCYPNGQWVYAGDYWNDFGIEEIIGDAEVTVLVRKEES